MTTWIFGTGGGDSEPAMVKKICAWANFTLSQATANDYMRIARRVDEEGRSFIASYKTIDEAVGREPRTIKSVTKKNKLKSVTTAPAAYLLRPPPVAR